MYVEVRLPTGKGSEIVAKFGRLIPPRQGVDNNYTHEDREAEKQVNHPGRRSWDWPIATESRTHDNHRYSGS